MAPVLVAPKIILSHTEPETSKRRLGDFPFIHFRRKNRNGSGAGFQVFRMAIEFIEHRGKGDENGDAENQDLFPEIFEEMFLGDEHKKQKGDDDGRRDAEGDVGVEAQAANQTGNQEVGIFLGAETPQQEIEREGKDKRGHYGAEADAREIDRPIGKGGQVGTDEPGPLTAENFFGKQIDAQDGQGAEQDGCQLERQHARSQNLNEKRLDVDEKSFASVVVGIEKLVISGAVGVLGIDAVDCFIRIDARRQILDAGEPEKEGSDDDGEEQEPIKKLFLLRFHFYF